MHVGHNVIFAIIRLIEKHYAPSVFKHAIGIGRLCAGAQFDIVAVYVTVLIGGDEQISRSAQFPNRLNFKALFAISVVIIALFVLQYGT